MANRRDFLKGMLAGGAAATTAVVAPPAVARETHPRPPEALGLLYDATLCVGCKACVAACKAANDNPPVFNTVDPLWDTPLDTNGYTFNIIKMYRNGTMDAKDQEENGYSFMKVSCMHCADPSCVSACPVSAMTKDPVTGVVGYDADKCIGCRYCVAACGPDQSYETPAGKYLQHVYGEKEYGGTQVLKLSGVNFQKVGMPNLPPDAAAALSETIQHTLYGNLIMPFAVLGAMTFMAKRNIKPEPESGDGKEG